MLRSFVIDGFRTFEHLHLAGLGAVNLITGRNNVGKTVLLEALRVYGSGGDVQVVTEQLRARDEVVGSRNRAAHGLPYFVDITALFHGRPALNGVPLSLTLGPSGGQGRRLRVRAGVAGRPGDSETLAFVSPPAGGSRDELILGLGVQWDDEREVIDRLNSTLPWKELFKAVDYVGNTARPELDAVPFVSATGLPRKVTSDWWDAISLTDAEERVLACLRMVVPVEKVALVTTGDMPDGRSFVFKLRGEGDRVPMRALGDGVGRMFWMALALEIARAGGLLLIDELENGIHYSVLPDLWRFILRAAAAQGVQVFATTHSWDCIEAFQTAVSESASDGALIRLTRRGDAVEPTVFNREELAVATRGEIELR